LDVETTFRYTFLLATCNVCPLAIPEFFAHNMGIWLLANHSFERGHAECGNILHTGTLTMHADVASSLNTVIYVGQVRQEELLQ